MRWQEQVVQRFNLDGTFIYIVNDPDGVLFEPDIALSLQEKMAVVFDEEDPFVLRLTYEKWRTSSNVKALLIRVPDTTDLFIPFDITERAKFVDLHISEFFNDIDVSILRLLPASQYQPVFDALSMYKPGRLNRQASSDFLLRHVYRIAPEIIQSNTDLVRLLIRKHYIGIDMPINIEARLIELLSLNKQFSAWDFNALVLSRTLFFDFLQEQWSIYLHSELKNVIASPKWPEHQLCVPFADSDIRVFIDNLFAEGILKPIELDDLPRKHWGQIGIKKEVAVNDIERLNVLFKKENEIFADEGTLNLTVEFWLEQSHSLGIMNALHYKTMYQPEQTLLSEKINKLNSHVDLLFQSWLLVNFSKLQTMPTVRYPAMLHRVPDWLSRRVSEGKKICLLVLDGMGARQWPLLREHLQSCKNIMLDEHSCFAWVPTITSISRQALFSGKKPFAFPDSLLTTNKEEQLWRDFWQDKELQKREVVFSKKVEMLSDDDWLSLSASSLPKVLGLVINFIDDQMHGMKMGMSGLNMVVDAWLREWEFKEKIAVLLDHGFEVVITSDHGNHEAVGIGNINEGIKAETRGERVRLYQDPLLRENTAKACRESVIVWPGPDLGLPKTCYPLIASGAYAFKSKGERIVGHGGISLHEAIVPFIIVNRKK